MKGMFIIRFQSGDVCRAEIHWSEAHGKGKKELKIKRFWDRQVKKIMNEFIICVRN